MILKPFFKGLLDKRGRAYFYLRLMKLTPWMLVLSCLHVSAGAFSQHVSLKMKNTSVREVLKAIENQTGYYLFWSDAQLDQHRISVDIMDAPIDEAIHVVLAELPVSFSITKKSVVIIPDR